jgi:hypothetical protein
MSYAKVTTKNGSVYTFDYEAKRFTCKQPKDYKGKTYDFDSGWVAYTAVFSQVGYYMDISVVGKEHGLSTSVVLKVEFY